MKKKLLSMLMAVTMVTAITTGCGGSDQASTSSGSTSGGAAENTA